MVTRLATIASDLIRGTGGGPATANRMVREAAAM
jgi:hypothetical protein